MFGQVVTTCRNIFFKAYVMLLLQVLARKWCSGKIFIYVFQTEWLIYICNKQYHNHNCWYYCTKLITCGLCQSMSPHFIHRIYSILHDYASLVIFINFINTVICSTHKWERQHKNQSIFWNKANCWRPNSSHPIFSTQQNAH